MFKKMFAFLLSISVLLAACTPQATPTATPQPTQAAPVKIRLPMGYIPNIQYAPFYVAIERGYFKDAGIEIEFDYSFETDGVALVGAGELPFAIVSGEQVLLARAKGLPVVYVTAWYQKYPVSIIAKSKSGITKPEEMKGRKIGLPGLFGANYIGLRAVLFSLNMQETDLTLDSIGYNQVEALTADQEDAIVGYAANEPVILRAKGFELNEWRVSDYAQLAANGIITNEKTIIENPNLVRNFVAAFLHGLDDTILDPGAAYEISKKYVENLADAEPTVQNQILGTSIEMWRAERLGYSDPKSWEGMQRVLLDMKLYDQALDLGKVFTNEFLPKP